MKKMELRTQDWIAVVFKASDDGIRMEKLFGLQTTNVGSEKMQGPVVVCTSRGRFEHDALKVASFKSDKRNATIVLDVDSGGLALTSQWSLCAESGVLSRRDTLTNTAKTPVTIHRCQARFGFVPARYEIYSQDSGWCNESQGCWAPLRMRAVTLGHEWGRSTRGGTPYACIREADSESGVIFHLIPNGNWTIRISAQAVPGERPCAIVECGLSDEDLHVELGPGESLELPEILIQELPCGEPRYAAPALHRYALKNLVGNVKPDVPVVYNTWFDQGSCVDVPRLRKQVAAAGELGCEVFVVDAGWYGRQEGNWENNAGDWREKLGSAFDGEMKAFGDEVRAAGLGFGLWMEAERFADGVPVRQEHPEWFLPTVDNMARLKLEEAKPYQYLKSEISRLIETYELVWMKIDHNRELGFDASGRELQAYTQGWYRLLDEITAKYPTVMENCASGGMRLELRALQHFDCHFLSDTAHPIDAIRINEGTLLRMLPGRIGRWAVARSVGQTIPLYDLPVSQSPDAIVTPIGAIWQPSEALSIDFIVAGNLPGALGISGDLQSLPREARERLAEHVSFFKTWRRTIAESVGHLLTPVRPKADREGWSVLQLHHEADDVSLLFAYRLQDARHAMTFRLRGLVCDRTYEITAHIPSTRQAQTVTGEQLMTDGVAVEAGSVYSAVVLVIRQK